MNSRVKQLWAAVSKGHVVPQQILLRLEWLKGLGVQVKPEKRKCPRATKDSWGFLRAVLDSYWDSLGILGIAMDSLGTLGIPKDSSGILKVLMDFLLVLGLPYRLLHDSLRIPKMDSSGILGMGSWIRDPRDCYVWIPYGSYGASHRFLRDPKGSWRILKVPGIDCLGVRGMQCLGILWIP